MFKIALSYSNLRNTKQIVSTYQLPPPVTVQSYNSAEKFDNKCPHLYSLQCPLVT